MRVQLSMLEWEEVKDLLIALLRKIESLTDEEQDELEKRVSRVLKGEGICYWHGRHES